MTAAVVIAALGVVVTLFGILMTARSARMLKRLDAEAAQHAATRTALQAETTARHDVVKTEVVARTDLAKTEISAALDTLKAAFQRSAALEEALSEQLQARAADQERCNQQLAEMRAQIDGVLSARRQDQDDRARLAGELHDRVIELSEAVGVAVARAETAEFEVARLRERCTALEQRSPPPRRLTPLGNRR